VTDNTRRWLIAQVPPALLCSAMGVLWLAGRKPILADALGVLALSVVSTAFAFILLRKPKS